MRMRILSVCFVFAFMPLNAASVLDSVTNRLPAAKKASRVSWEQILGVVKSKKGPYSIKQSDKIVLKNVHLDHFFSQHKLDISLIVERMCCLGDTSINLKKLKGELLAFIEKYPNRGAYWEVVNKDLVRHIAKSMPELDNINLRIKVFKSAGKENNRWSQVIYTRGKGEEEHFGFIFNPGEVPDEGFKKNTLILDFVYDNDPKPNEYLNFFDVKEGLIRFFEQHPLGNEPALTMQQSLQGLLKKYPQAAAFSLELRRTFPSQYGQEETEVYTATITRD